ncbi:MAG TPA: GGDEF domain-containing protein [Oceanospirillales bacterium]|nr:GGDEF domain-containing protein [Oceanospirillales bacterium]
MKFAEVNQNKDKGFNIFKLIIVSTILMAIINFSFYSVKSEINYFDLVTNFILLLITFYLIYITQKNSTNKSGFYYYTSIGFAFVYFGLFILTFNQLFSYRQDAIEMAFKLLSVIGYGLLAIGVSKWVNYNNERQDELSIQANTDELTGILNRRSFTSFLKFEFKKAQSRPEPFALLIIDIDFFKNINDSYGHQVGDEILKCLAKLMKESFRQADKVCRWGGEEFAILLPYTTLNNAQTVAEKIRASVENSSFDNNGVEIKYTISVGISEFLSSDKSLDDIIKRTDDALYKAKNEGRNCIRSIRR